MAYPVSRERSRTSLSLSAASSAAGASCACDDDAGVAAAQPGIASGSPVTFALLAPWLAVALIAAMLFIGG